jgi:hypothetical protein
VTVCRDITLGDNSAPANRCNPADPTAPVDPAALDVAPTAYLQHRARL